MEEYGVPIPLGRKLSFLVSDAPSFEDATAIVLTYCRSTEAQAQLSNFERNLVEAALG
jgi:hypothetical protein